MDAIYVRGGTRLRGTVAISGAKNAALPILAATLLSPGRHRIGNVPALRDVTTTRKLLGVLGANCGGEGEITVDTGPVGTAEASYDLVKTMRASILVLGPLLARTGRARVSLPGGCAIGERPVDLHLKAMEALGAEIAIEHGYIEARADGLKGGTVTFEKPTVTGTANAMMAAVLADGRSIIENAACEPELPDLAGALASMGAEIRGAGTRTIVIDGREKLGTISWDVMPDRIETGTLMVAAAMTRGDVEMSGARAGDCEAVIDKLREAGVKIGETAGGVRVQGPTRTKSVDVKTGPYPAFPTDMQAQFMALLAVSRGLGVITETIFENRFMHAAELKRMGADITLEGNHALIRGRKDLSGAQVMATDLRASASLVLAGLRAGGETVVSRVYHLDRGYEKLEEKLSSLGGRATRRKGEGI